MPEGMEKKDQAIFLKNRRDGASYTWIQKNYKGGISRKTISQAVITAVNAIADELRWRVYVNKEEEQFLRLQNEIRKWENS